MDRSNWLTYGIVLASMAASVGCSGTDEPSPPFSSGSLGVQSAPPKTALRDPVVMTKIRTTVLERSSFAGVASPATMHAVAVSDHQAAESIVSGAIINDHSPVYVVQMTGGPFVVPHHPRASVAPPQGDVLTITLDAQTYRVTDVGYDSVAPDLSRMDSDVVDLMAAP